MIKVKNIDGLLQLGFKEYNKGFSLKLCNNNYSFIDILYEDFIVKKVMFIEDHFEYENAEETDIKVLINRCYKNKTEEFKEEFFNKTFEIKN